METATKSFPLNDFIVELALRENVLFIKAESQTTWRFFSQSLTEDEVRSRFGHICSTPQELFLTLADAFSGLFPELSLALSNSGDLTYSSKVKVGSQQRKNQFTIQLEERKADNYLKYEKRLFDLTTKVKEQEREICRLNILLQQSEKKKMEETNKLLTVIENFKQRLDGVEKFLAKTSFDANKTQLPEKNKSSGPLLQSKSLGYSNPFEQKLTAANFASRQNQGARFSNGLVSGQAQIPQNAFPSFRGSLTPAPNSSKTNFLFWGVGSETSAAASTDQNFAKTPGGSTSKPSSTLWNGVYQGPASAKPEKSGQKFHFQDASTLFGPRKDAKLNIQTTGQLTPGKVLEKDKSGSQINSSSSSDMKDQNPITRNFSFQQEVEEKKEEEDETPDTLGNTTELVQQAINKAVDGKADQIEELILDKIIIKEFTDEIAKSIEKYSQSLLCLSLNACSLNNISKLPNLPNLVKLELLDNKLKGSDLSSLTKFPKLEALSIGGNPITNFEELESLKKLENLIQLDLLGSPVAEKPDYRKKLFEILPKLAILDNFDIEGKEIDYDAILEEAEEKSTPDSANNEKKILSEKVKDEGIATGGK